MSILKAFVVFIVRKLTTRESFDGFCTEMEVARRTVGDAVMGEQILEITHATLQIVHIGPRNLSLRNGIEARTFDTDLFARGACWQVLVAAVLAYSAAITSGDIAEGGRGCVGVGAPGPGGGVRRETRRRVGRLNGLKFAEGRVVRQPSSLM